MDAGEDPGAAELDLGPDPHLVGESGEGLVARAQEGPDLTDDPGAPIPTEFMVPARADEGLGVLVVGRGLGGEIVRAAAGAATAVPLGPPS